MSRKPTKYMFRNAGQKAAQAKRDQEQSFDKAASQLANNINLATQQLERIDRELSAQHQVMLKYDEIFKAMGWTIEVLDNGLLKAVHVEP